MTSIFIKSYVKNLNRNINTDYQKALLIVNSHTQDSLRVARVIRYVYSGLAGLLQGGHTGLLGL